MDRARAAVLGSLLAAAAAGHVGVLNPKTLDPAASVDFCGACHATWWDVTLARETGIAALRCDHRIRVSSETRPR